MTNDTTYAAGSGLTLGSGNQFSIASDYQVKNDQSCTTGQFASGINATGTLTCAAPATGARVFANLISGGIGIPSDATPTNVVSLSIPAGAYSITAIGNGTQVQVDREWSMTCTLYAGSTELSHAFVDDGGAEDARQRVGRSMAMVSLRNFSAPTTLVVQCTTGNDGVGAEHFGIQAISVD